MPLIDVKSLETTIDTWLERVEIVNPAPKRRTDDFRSSAGMASPPRSLSPSKRQRVSCTDNDAAATPRPTKIPCTSIHDDVSDIVSLSISQISGQSGQSAKRSGQSGRSSPVKKEAAMRQASELPLRRKPLDELLEAEPQFPDLVQFIKRLADLKDKEGILPRVLEQHIRSRATLSDPIRDWMFSPRPEEEPPEYQHHNLYVYERVRRICKASQQCNDAAHPIHEVEWNDKVHAALLELALDTAAISNPTRLLVYHNITNVRLAKEFQDRDLLLKENRVDYGIFLAPDSDSELGQRIAMHQRRQRDSANALESHSQPQPQLHALHAYEPDRPLAISIETKRNRGNDGQAPSQLANWARAHFRAISETLRACRDSDHVGESSGLVHPLIELDGTAWHISFAIREGRHVTVYSSVRLGSTETVTDCYALLRCLEQVAWWCANPHWNWWTKILQRCG
ncbi:hypothetical protein GGS23DRAFT_591388 [Durotheca rogersii]|uniref:uncharacterized protein n=1 Tax=Durotheca rogersii TaxID=419775 RepID=UPI00222068AB|nr:uncharacterized protein GGS23DRAFT_591388 [Durotheca rogersii]KAI5852049.1 hypothetical protein GGS23DRAFT_591388 [Durotheca rogersii]